MKLVYMILIACISMLQHVAYAQKQIADSILSLKSSTKVFLIIGLSDRSDRTSGSGISNTPVGTVIASLDLAEEVLKWHALPDLKGTSDVSAGILGETLVVIDFVRQRNWMIADSSSELIVEAIDRESFGTRTDLKSFQEIISRLNQGKKCDRWNYPIFDMNSDNVQVKIELDKSESGFGWDRIRILRKNRSTTIGIETLATSGSGLIRLPKLDRN